MRTVGLSTSVAQCMAFFDAGVILCNFDGFLRISLFISFPFPSSFSFDDW